MKEKFTTTPCRFDDTTGTPIPFIKNPVPFNVPPKDELGCCRGCMMPQPTGQIIAFIKKKKPKKKRNR